MSQMAGAKCNVIRLLRRLAGGGVLLYALLAPAPAAADACYGLYYGCAPCVYYSPTFGDIELATVCSYTITPNPFPVDVTFTNAYDGYQLCYAIAPLPLFGLVCPTPPAPSPAPTTPPPGSSPPSEPPSDPLDCTNIGGEIVVEPGGQTVGPCGVM